MNNDLVVNNLMDNIFSIKTVTWQDVQQDLIRLRTLVFMQEQNVSAVDEWDGKDETATHFLVCNTQHEAIGCARTLTENHPEQTLLHIGRVAILKQYRQQGIGQQLMQTVIHWCIQHHPASAIYLHAQTTRLSFYQHLNFVTQGEVFMDAGISHIEMWYKPQK